MTLCNGRAALRALVAAAALCSATLMAASPAHAAPDAKFVLISHAPDSDSWWNTIKNAIKQADEDFNVQTDYRNPPNGDIADMSRLIEQAAARNYDGVITTIADFDVLKSSLNKVTAKKIPLVTINSGTEEQSAQLGAIMHVGQPEYVAGKAAGEKAKAAGIKSFLCVNHIATNTVSFDRCRGFADSAALPSRVAPRSSCFRRVRRWATEPACSATVPPISRSAQAPGCRRHGSVDADGIGSLCGSGRRSAPQPAR